MEVWNNEFYDTNILNMVKEIYKENSIYYEEAIYTDENIKRMLPFDDIVDISNCLRNNSIEGGSKYELEEFLKNKKNITIAESNKLKSRFKKTFNNMKQILPRTELKSSQYSKRTHFISLFLTVTSHISDYYLHSDLSGLREALLEFIDNQPRRYKESVLGGIRQKDKRQTRVKLLQKIILRHAVKLDAHRLFEDSVKRRLWRNSRPLHICALCGRKIGSYEAAAVDHILPWAKGGKTVPTNAQLTHNRCNQKKRDAVEEFIVF
jgi:5-methylcytosine-specific restriction endonuclease McrA